MALMILMSEGGAKLDYDKVMRLLHLTVDVIVQFGTDGCGRYVREIDYNPERKLALAAGGAR
jgi:type IV secretion system protein VirB11